MKLSEMTDAVNKLMGNIGNDVVSMMPPNVNMQEESIQQRLRDLRKDLYGLIIEVAHVNGIDIDLEKIK